MKTKRNTLLGSLLAAGMFALAPLAQAIPVDTELALVIDVSGSVDATDYQLQMDGYAAAFNNAVVQNNIANLTNGMAIEVFFFSSTAVAAGIETVLTSAADASAFATAIGGLVRPFNGGTNPATGINLAVNWLENNNYESSNRIIDVSGDGTGNATSDQAARDAADALDIVINGLAIDDPPFFSDGCGPTGYYTLNIITPGAACFQATGFGDFERAVLAKIQAETGGGGVPAPATLALLGLGLAGIGYSRKKAAA